MTSASTSDLLEQAMDLPEEERARLASALVASLDGPEDPDAEEAWAREIERRARAVIAGDVKGRPWEEVRARLARRFQR